MIEVTEYGYIKEGLEIDDLEGFSQDLIDAVRLILAR